MGTVARFPPGRETMGRRRGALPRTALAGPLLDAAIAIAALIAMPSNPLAKPAAVLLMFAHGISIALLFCLADRIERSTGSLDFTDLGGLAKSAPFQRPIAAPLRENESRLQPRRTQRRRRQDRGPDAGRGPEPRH